MIYAICYPKSANLRIKQKKKKEQRKKKKSDESNCHMGILTRKLE